MYIHSICSTLCTLATRDASTDCCRIGETLNEIFQLPTQWDDESYEGLDREFGGLPEELPDVRAWEHSDRVMTAWRGPLLDPGNWEGLPE